MIDDFVAVIPARLGSSRVDRKVLQSLDGKESLLRRKVRQLKNVLPSSRIVVNTESEVLAEEVADLGIRIDYRNPYYADGHKASFSEVISHVISSLDFSHIAWAPCVVPFFSAEHFIESFERYQKHVVGGNFDSLVSVVRVHDYFWDDRGPINYEASRNHTISQELPNWYRVTNGLYIAPKSVMLEHRYILGEKVFLDLVPDQCGIDIDTIDDLKLARAFERGMSAED